MRSSFAKLSTLTGGGAALSLVLSCSSRAEDSTGFSAAVDFCQHWLDAAAVASARCLGASETAIRTLAAQLNVCLDVSASLATLHLKYDPQFAEACLTETQALACSSTLPALTACNQVFKGVVPVGGACSPLAFDNLSECVTGSQCKTSALCAGRCVPAAKLGEACEGAAAGKSCDIDLTCDPTLRVCLADRTLGVACSSDHLCSGTLVCEGQNGPVQFIAGASAGGGTCQAPADSGPCYYDDDCGNHRCLGAAPPDSTGQCMPRTALGAPCTPGANECLLGAYCGADGRCVNLPSLGESCAANVGEGSVCLDSYCDPGSATCVAFLHAGDPCALSSSPGSQPDPCGGARLVCDSGYCAPICLSAQHCGQVGEACCALQQCSKGSSCVRGKCSVSG